MKQLLTYGLLLLTILASPLIMSACQDDLPDTTEVMMTFTTRAVVTDKVDSNAPDEDKMKDLRVIMLRQDGTVVDNHLEPNINASSVTFTFTTPITTGGEDFTFLAVANEESIQSELSWLNCSPGDNLLSSLSDIKAQQIGNGEAFDISDGPIPQTKQWTVTVPQQDTHVENQTLDFVASKISVQFINNTNAEQSLSGIKITGIGSNVYGYLFAQENSDFVGTQHVASDITFTDITNLAAGATSDAQTYYTYPVGSVTTPTLYATWNGTQYDLPIEINDEFITALNRNDHLKIVVTLTGQELTVNYTIADWVSHATNIGSPTTEGGYNVDEWGNGNDVEIGGEDESDEPVVPGSIVWEYQGDDIEVSGWGTFNSDLDESDKANFETGRILTIEVDFITNSGDGVLKILSMGDGPYSNANYESLKNKYYPSTDAINVTSDIILECVLTDKDVDYINHGGLHFFGNACNITRIYVSIPETQ